MLQQPPGYTLYITVIVVQWSYFMKNLNTSSNITKMCLFLLQVPEIYHHLLSKMPSWQYSWLKKTVKHKKFKNLGVAGQILCKTGRYVKTCYSGWFTHKMLQWNNCPASIGHINEWYSPNLPFKLRYSHVFEKVYLLPSAIYTIWIECSRGGNFNDSICNIRVTSWWARWHLKSLASWLFAQPFVQAQKEENIKALHHWSLLGESTGDQWIPLTKGQ